MSLHVSISIRVFNRSSNLEVRYPRCLSHLSLKIDRSFGLRAELFLIRRHISLCKLREHFSHDSKKNHGAVNLISASKNGYRRENRSQAHFPKFSATHTAAFVRSGRTFFLRVGLIIFFLSKMRILRSYVV